MNRAWTVHFSYRGLLATVATAALVVSGAGLIGIALASQNRAPRLSASVDHRTDVAPSPSLEALEIVGPILARSKPVSLDIPSIDVHSPLHDVGLTAKGMLEVPAGPRYDEAAWYRHSPTPGSLGPAVILGHMDSATNGPSVFFRLGELQRNDEILVTRADGSTAFFVVEEVRRYSKNDFPTDLVYGDINHAGLRILTCGGAFDDATGHYEDNVVVFASLAHPSHR